MYQQVNTMHEEELSGPAFLIVWLVAIGTSIGVVVGIVALGFAAYRWVIS